MVMAFLLHPTIPTHSPQLQFSPLHSPPCTNSSLNFQPQVLEGAARSLESLSKRQRSLMVVISNSWGYATHIRPYRSFSILSVQVSFLSLSGSFFLHQIELKASMGLFPLS